MPKKPVKRHSVTQPSDQSYRLIPLTQGQNAIVDADDFERLSQWNWCAAWAEGTQSFYAMAWRQGGGHIRMHAKVIECPRGMFIDHKNHDTLDNRKSNLRLCTYTQNLQNQMRRTTNSSGFKGVYKYGAKWTAHIRVNKKKIHLGTFTTSEAASLAYKEAAKHYFGEFSWS